MVSKANSSTPEFGNLGDGKDKRDAREGRGKVKGCSGRSQVNWYVKTVGLGEKVLVFKINSSIPKFDDMDRGRVKGASRESRERVRECRMEPIEPEWFAK